MVFSEEAENLIKYNISRVVVVVHIMPIAQNQNNKMLLQRFEHKTEKQKKTESNGKNNEHIQQ